jgi:hypothetical protein
VVEVASHRRHPASGEHAGAVASLDDSLLVGSGATARGPGVSRLAGLSAVNGIAPFGARLIGCDLASYVGDDRAVSGEVAWSVHEMCEGPEVHMYVDHSPASAVGVTFEKIKQHVGAELIHRA